MNEMVTYAGSLQPAGSEAVSLPGEMNWESAVERFLSEADIKYSSRDTYRKSLQSFFRWVEKTGRELSMLSRADIIAFKEDNLRDGNRHSVMYVRLQMSAVRRFYGWAEEMHLCNDIAKSIKLPKNRETFVKQHLSSKECVDMLDAMLSDEDSLKRKIRFDSADEVSSRNYAIINLMLRTGLRTIEVSRLDIMDITMKHGKRILLVWGKGRDSKDNFVPLNDKAYGPIEEYLRLFRGDALMSEPMFAAAGTNSRGNRLTPRMIQMVCKKALRSIGLDDHSYSAHSLRHTCAVQILKNGGTMFDVKTMLRHSRPETSEIYVKSVEEEMRIVHSPDIYLENAYDSNGNLN